MFKNIFVAPLPLIGAVAISLLEVLVALLQAYIFTLLSAVFIGAAVHQGH
jgi:F-type H+-transporting ATPase subunit a